LPVTETAGTFIREIRQQLSLKETNVGSLVARAEKEFARVMAKSEAGMRQCLDEECCRAILTASFPPNDGKRNFASCFVHDVRKAARELEQESSLLSTPCSGFNASVPMNGCANELMRPLQITGRYSWTCDNCVVAGVLGSFSNLLNLLLNGLLVCRADARVSVCVKASVS